MLSFTRDLDAFDLPSAKYRRLGCILAFVAGATNAGGFLAVGVYTSHMTGLVSSIADNLVLRQFEAVLSAVGALVAFLLGAMTTAVIVSWARRRRLRSLFALPLLLEALLLLLFGVLGVRLEQRMAFVIPWTIAVLSYLMGVQNAVITKITRSAIRTTHVTGLVTDLGIELGKLVYVNRSRDGDIVRADRDKLRIYLLLIGNFLLGGLTGALGFKRFGFIATVPLAVLVSTVAIRPLLHDLAIRARLLRRRRSRG